MTTFKAYRTEFCVFRLAIFSVLITFSCHSLPPSQPIESDESVDLRRLSWQQAAIPTELFGDWYTEGELDLTVKLDTLYVHRIRTLIRSIEKADNYYRIIYAVENIYRAAYFRNLTEIGLQAAYTDSSAGDIQGAAECPVTSRWYTLTSTIPWIPAILPGNLPGNWHIHDGNMEIAIAGTNAVVDGASWTIDSVQTNRHVGRLLLKAGNGYKSLYYNEVGDYDMEVLLVDGKKDMQDRMGNIQGDWTKVYRWWDFIEKGNFYPGARWSYQYFYKQYIDQVFDTSSPRDSIARIESLEGRFDLEVLSNTISGETGSLMLKATFQIDTDGGKYYHAKKDGTTQVQTDSSWSNPGSVKTVQHEIVLENDTLWFKTSEGKIFFASKKLRSRVNVNYLLFLHPIDFPKEGFPAGRLILGEILFPYEEKPFKNLYNNDINSEIIWVLGVDIVIQGQLTNNYAYFSLGTGFKSVNYHFEDNDQRIRFGRGEYHNPYIKDTTFKLY